MTTGMKYEASKRVSAPTKEGIRVISEMTTPRILMFVARKHASGLKTFAILSLAGYITYDKVISIFV